MQKTEPRPKTKKPWKLCLRQVNLRILRANDVGAICRFMAGVYSTWITVASQCAKKRHQKRAVILRKRFARFLLICHQMKKQICSQATTNNAARDLKGLSYQGLMAALLSQYFNVALLAIDTSSATKSVDTVMKLQQFLGDWPEKVIDSLLGITVFGEEDNGTVFSKVLRRVIDEIAGKVTRPHYVKLVILIKRWLPYVDECLHKEIWESFWKIPVSTRMEDFLRSKLEDRFHPGRSRDVVRSVLKKLSIKGQKVLLSKMDRRFKHALKRAISAKDSEDIDEVHDEEATENAENLTEAPMIGFFFDSKGAPLDEDSVKQQEKLQSLLHENVDELIRDSEFTPVQIVAPVRQVKHITDYATVKAANQASSNGPSVESNDVVEDLLQTNDPSEDPDDYLKDMDVTAVDETMFDSSSDNFATDLSQLLSSSTNTDTMSNDVVSISADEKSLTESTQEYKDPPEADNKDPSKPSSITSCSVDTEIFDVDNCSVPTVSPKNHYYTHLSPLDSVARKRKQPVIVLERDANLDLLSVTSNGNKAIDLELLCTQRHEDAAAKAVKRLSPLCSNIETKQAKLDVREADVTPTTSRTTERLVRRSTRNASSKTCSLEVAKCK